MRDRPGIGVAETRFVPDMRIIRRGGSQSDQARRFIAKIPLHAIDACTSLGFQLANDFAICVEDFELDWILWRCL